MRGVTQFLVEYAAGVVISTHTPHAGRDKFNMIYFEVDTEFQLTRPMRGVTYAYVIDDVITYNFNSHAPCGA